MINDTPAVAIFLPSAQASVRARARALAKLFPTDDMQLSNFVFTPIYADAFLQRTSYISSDRELFMSQVRGRQATVSNIMRKISLFC